MRRLVVLALATVAAAQADPIGRWVFDRDHLRGNRLLDQAGAAHATVTGRKQLLDRPRAMVFRGRSDRVILDRTLRSKALPTRAFTVAAWVSVDRAQAWGGIVSVLQDNGGFEKGWLLGYRESRFCFALATRGADDGDGVMTYLHGRTEFGLGRWFHVAGSYDGATMRLFVNGELEAESGAQSGDVLYPDRTTFELGAYVDDNEHYPFVGLIGDVTIHGAALDPEVVRSGYRARASDFAPAAAELETLGRWRVADERVHGRTLLALEGRDATIDGVAELRRSRQPHALEGGRVSAAIDRAPQRAVSIEAAWFLEPRDRTLVHGAGLALDYRDGHLRAGVTTAESQSWTATERPVEPFRWHHVVASYDGSLLRLFVDGELAGFSRDAHGPVEAAGTVVAETGGAFHELAVHSGAAGVEFARRRWRRVREVFPRSLRLAVPPRLRFDSRHAATIAWELAEPGEARYEYRLDSVRRGGVVDGRRQSFTVDALFPGAELRFRVFRVVGDREHTTEWHAIDTTFNYSLPDRPPRAAPYPSAPRFAAIAEHVVRSTGITRGYCLVLDAGDGELCRELAVRTDLEVIGVERDGGAVRRARRALARAGLYGARVSIHRLEGDQLPYTAEFANLIVAGANTSVPLTEVERVLRPSGGVALLGPTAIAPDRDGWRTIDGWARLDRGALGDSGEWTHQYGDGANTASSDDRLVGDQLAVQWFGRPGPRPMLDRGCRSPAPLYSDGRLIVQGDRKLFGLDAYNGTMLWTLEIPALRRVNLPRDSSNQTVRGRDLYLAVDDRAWQLDAQTGELVRTLTIPGDELDDDAWGYIGVAGELLLGTRTLDRAIYRGADGQWYDRTGGEAEAVLGSSVFAIQRGDASTRWVYRGGLIVHPTITVHRGTLYFVEDREPDPRSSSSGRLVAQDGESQYLMALDLATGQPLWERQFDFRKCDRVFYLSARDDTLVALGTDDGYYLYGFDASSGVALWRHHHAWQRDHHGGAMQHPVLLGDRVYAEMKALDLRTGEVVRDDLPERRGCGTMSASARALFFRHYDHGTWDLDSDRRSQMPGIRSGCWLGMIPAGGLLLAPESSSGCSCADPIQTSVAFRGIR